MTAMNPRSSTTRGRETAVPQRRLAAALVCLAAALFAGSSVVACGDDCSGPPPGMLVILHGAGQGGTCSAFVNIRLGDQNSNLSCVVEGSDCRCQGGTTPGDYELTVQRGSTVIATGGLTVEEDSCELVQADFST